MQSSALASGSSGNCFFIEANNTPFLIDAGISAKQICRRLESLGKDPEKIKGIFITHEHSDHIKGVDVLARKYNIPVYLTRKCHENCNIESDHSLVRHIEKDKELDFHGIKILPFSKNHDASDPVSYAIAYREKKLSVMTDIGLVCNNVIDHISGSDLIFMESNHDLQMLEKGPYPAYLKKRIASDFGHLSNYAAALCLLEHASPKLKHVILSHLSENNNTEEIALKTIRSLLSTRKDLSLKIHLSGRQKPTEIITI
ncbi:MAG: MBL fold metallo-hydrolase [Nanoarchaeota archaeon]|nr:MBL fold metallo-hydrolase [Nanoarchaeota archaeon]